MALLMVRGGELALSFRSGMWVVSRQGEEIRTLRLHEVDEVQCWGGVEVRASARVAALARGLPLVFLTADGRYRGRLDGPRSHTASIQLAQVRWLADDGRRLALARSLVRGKLLSQRTLLMDLQRHRRHAAIAAAACTLRALLSRVELAPSLEGLRGLEGLAASTYFSAFKHLLMNPDFSFSGRNRRPPRDPINACLSFGYALLAIRVESALEAVGLHPGAGALHESIRGQSALTFDLMEEFRAPVVDRMVLRLLNRRQLSPEDFEDPAWRRPLFNAPTGKEEDAPPPERAGSPPLPVAVHLGPAARRLVVREFTASLREARGDATEEARIRLDWLLERQARRLARVFQEKTPQYVAFLEG